MSAKTIHELHEKYYAKKSKKEDVKVDKSADPVVQKPIATEADVKKIAASIVKKIVVSKPKVKVEKKVRTMKIRKNGVLRIGGNHIVDKYGFKKLQEFTVDNPSAGVITIKGK